MNLDGALAGGSQRPLREAERGRLPSLRETAEQKTCISGDNCYGFSVMPPMSNCFLWLDGPLTTASGSPQLMDCNIKTKAGSCLS